MLVLLLLFANLVFCSLNASNSQQDVLIILEHPRLIFVDGNTGYIDIKFEICFEWESEKLSDADKKRQLLEWSEEEEFGILAENVIPGQKSLSLLSRGKHFTNVRTSKNLRIPSEKQLVFSRFPSDSHYFYLRFISSLKNSSQLTLNPHFVTSSIEEMDTPEFQFEMLKSFVQWVVHKNQSFEQAVFEFKITRKVPNFVSSTLISLFFANILIIFTKFPVFLINSWRQKSKSFLIGTQFIIVTFASYSSPRTGSMTTFDYQLLSLLALSIWTELLAQILPFFVFHLKCSPMEADPNPPRYPSPSDQFSLDSERSKCHAALDSARAESIRSPRVANFDMCLAEVKFTMTNFSEVMNLHSSAEWRQKIWRNAYCKFEIFAFVILNIVNFALLYSF